MEAADPAIGGKARMGRWPSCRAASLVAPSAIGASLAHWKKRKLLSQMYLAQGTLPYLVRLGLHSATGRCAVDDGGGQVSGGGERGCGGRGGLRSLGSAGPRPQLTTPRVEYLDMCLLQATYSSDLRQQRASIKHVAVYRFSMAWCARKVAGDLILRYSCVIR